MAEVAPEGGGPHRVFVVLAIGLAALLIVGLVGVGGFFLLQTLSKPSSAVSVAVVTPSRAPATASPAAAAAQGAATPTLVNSSLGNNGAQTNLSAPAATAIPVSSDRLPESGLGEDLLLLAGGVALVVVIFVARRARTA